MITISNCPVTGLERKVDYDFHWLKTQKQVIISCVVSHYKDGEKVQAKSVIDLHVDLLADNGTKVDSATGQTVQAGPDGIYPEGYIGEYDYYATVVGTMPIVLPNLIQSVIQMRDQQGRFN